MDYSFIIQWCFGHVVLGVVKSQAFYGRENRAQIKFLSWQRRTIIYTETVAHFGALHLFKEANEKRIKPIQTL